MTLDRLLAARAFLPIAALVLLSGFSGHAPRAQRLAFLAGASGEERQPNFFVEDLKGLRERLLARGWTVSAAVGDKPRLLPDSITATNDNILQGATRALERAVQGEQVLLLFHSHGREREPAWGQKSHVLVSEDRDELGTEPGFDMDALEPPIRAARDRGVAVALVDLSCYSGWSQAIEGPSCTVSLAAPGYISLCSGRPEERGFTSRFFFLPPPGTTVDLESQFVAARAADLESINLPRISSRETPLLEAWDEFLYQVDPLDVSEDLRELRAPAKPFSRASLLQPFDQWSKSRPAASRAALPEIRGKLVERLDAALRVRADLDRTSSALARLYDVPTIELKLPGRAPLKLSPGHLSEILDGKVDGMSQPRRRLTAEIAPRKDELLAQYRHAIDGFRALRAAFDDATNELAASAGDLLATERDLYPHGAEIPAHATGCRDFAL